VSGHLSQTGAQNAALLERQTPTTYPETAPPGWAGPACSATARMAGRIASPGMLPSGDLLPHLKCSRPGFGGDGHEADQHGNA